MLSYRHLAVSAISLCLLGTSQARAQVAEFLALGDLPGGEDWSEVGGVSADGTTVVGTSDSDNGTEAFYWTRETGIVGIGDLAGGSFSSRARAVSADGNCIVGVSRSSRGNEAFRYFRSTGGWYGLGDLPGNDFSSSATGVNADGGVVVGDSIGYGGLGGAIEGFRWVAGSGMTGLGDLAGGSFNCHAVAVSADGNVVAAFSHGGEGNVACRWTPSSGLVSIGDLPGSTTWSRTWGISGDGSTIVGTGTASDGSSAFRWTSSGGMVALGGGANAAHDASYDGSVIVGTLRDDAGTRAAIWDPVNGTRDLAAMLTAEYGLDLSGWTLSEAVSVSDSGRVIAGNGINPAGVEEAWVVVLGAGIIYVDDNAPPGGDGRSWGTAYRYLQDALHNAYADDVVHVGQGTYRPDLDEAGLVTPNHRDMSFTLRTGVHLLGGFAGYGATDPNARDIATFETELSGQLDTTEAYHVVYLEDTSLDTLIDGCTITGGNANGSSRRRLGGGLYLYYANATIRNCAFHDNYAVIGGGVCASHGALEISYCAFVNNTASNTAGAYLSDASSVMQDCAFSQNHADGYLPNPILRLEDADHVIRDCTFTENTGYGIYVRGGDPLVENCQVQSCSLRGIDIDAGRVLFCEASGNGLNGIAASGSAVVSNCVIADNYRDGNGGGVVLYDEAVLADSLVVGNTAITGSGVRTESANCRVFNCTIVGNTNSGASPGGGYSGAAGAMIANCIVWGNAPDDFAPGLAVAACFETLDGDPLFADADGPDDDPTTWHDNNYRLLSGSPCVDAGDNTLVSGCWFDLDGRLRRADDPNTPDGGVGDPPVVDIGAYEFNGAVPIDCNGNRLADTCEALSGLVSDCNANGVPDDCDIADGFSVDCNANGAPDICDIVDGTSSDCNNNTVPDICDIVAGASYDCNGNGIPDECEPDCNGNGTPDDCDITYRLSLDCNENGIPDECDIAAGTSSDCNNNGAPDNCDIAFGTSPDCNGNGIPDACDIASGTSSDCDYNGRPDACDVAEREVDDCNGNGIPDDCDLVSGVAQDNNSNGIPDACEAAWIHVDNDAPGDPGPDDPNVSDPAEDGSAAHPFDTIQEGVDAANAGETVVVHTGSYSGPGNRDIEYGGRAITVRSLQPRDAAIVAATIIDCQASTDDRHRAFRFANNETPDAIVAGLTIINGVAPFELSAAPVYHLPMGGAIWGSQAGGTIEYCVFRDNHATWGGAIYFDECDLRLRHCLFEQNHCTEFHNGSGCGAAACLGPGPVDVVDCHFRRNTAAPLGWWAGGGALWLDRTQSTFRDCTFEENRAAVRGYAGAVFISEGDADFERCAFTGNIAEGGPDTEPVSGSGGAILADDQCGGTFSDCTFVRNYAANEAGACHTIYADLAWTFDGCTFAWNCAERRVDAVLGDYGDTLFLSNCLIWNGSNAFYYGGSPLGSSYCLIEGDVGYGTNVTGDARLTQDGVHVQYDAATRDQGDPNAVFAGRQDLDREARVHAGFMDIGADEFADSDGDHLPDWWEYKHFGSATAAVASLDHENDGRDNEAEYRYSSSPFLGPRTVYVAPDGNDDWDGRAAVFDGLHGPKATIQAALDVAQRYEGDEIILSPGVYSGPGNRDILLGGRIVTIRSSQPHNPDVVTQTVIDCGGSENEPHRAFLIVGGEGPETVLDGLTIIRGRAASGSAIYCRNSSPTIRRCVLRGNLTDGYWHYDGERGDGAVSAYGGDGLVIENCVFEGNVSFGAAAGLFVHECGPVAIENTLVIANSADWGGAVLCHEVQATFVGCTFTGNWTNGGNSAISNDSAELDAHNTLIWHNGPSSAYYELDLVTYCDIEGPDPDVPHNLAADPLFAAGPTGTWTDEGLYDPNTRWLTLTDDNARWVPDAYAGWLVSLNTLDDNGPTLLIVSNTFTELTAWAGLESINGADVTNPGMPYAIYSPRLTPYSPCIDAGDPGEPAADLFDVAGQPRITDGNDDGVPRIDIGAYEYHPMICLGDANCNGNVDWRDIDFFVAAQNDNVSAWHALHMNVYGTPPTCPFENSDIGGPTAIDVPDGHVDWRDIDGFVAQQNTACP